MLAPSAAQEATSTLSEFLVIYYDRSCPLCVAEMETLKGADQQARLALVDCSASGFSDAAAAAKGISAAEMLAALHVRDDAGRWYRGVEAFEQIYAILGIESIAKWLRKPWLKPWLERLYPVIARHRQFLSRLGVNRLFALLVGWHAKRAAARNCSESVCAVNVDADGTSAKPRDS